jgi:aspartate-semialdehyde dehydrogenase
MEKLRVGVLGATGMVGQNYIALLENHPWFTVTYLAASERSAGSSYRQAVAGRWHMIGNIPTGVENLMVFSIDLFFLLLIAVSLIYTKKNMRQRIFRLYPMRQVIV